MIQNQIIRIVALDQTKKAFASVKKGMAGVLGSIFSLKSALAVVAGATGFGLLVKSNMNAIDALAKTASRIGTTTDALTRLHHAGQLSGVTTNTLNMALQRMTRRVAEASRGTGEAKDAIRQLGINAQTFNDLPLDEKMLVLADRFSNVKSQSEQLRLAFKLFDSEGTAVVNMLKGGSDALEDMYQDAELLGLVMEQSSAKGVEKANDAITRLLSIGKGITSQFTAGLAPAIEAMSKHFTQLAIDSNKGFGTFKNLGQYLAKEFLLTIANVIDSIGKMGSYITATLDKVLLFTDRIQGKDTIRTVMADIEALNEKIREAEALDPAGIGEFTDYDSAYVDKLKDDLNKLYIKLADLGQVDEGLDFSGVVAYIRSLAGEIGNTNDALDNTGNDKQVQQLNKFGQAIENLKSKYLDMSQMVQSAVDTSFGQVTQAFTDGITGAKKFSDAFKDMARNVVNALIKMMVQYYITQPLFNALQTQFGGGGTPSAPVSTGSSSYGGTVSAGQAQIVGERGRELFIPNTNGAIVNSDQLAGGGGVVINQSINLSTGVSQTVKAEVMNMLPRIAEQTKQAVLDSRQRGGSFSRGLVGA